MGRRMNTNSSKILLPIPLYSVDYEALLKYVKEVDVHLASKYFDYPILIRNLNQLFSGYATSREFDCPVVVPKFSVQIYGSCNGLISWRLTTTKSFGGTLVLGTPSCYQKLHVFMMISVQGITDLAMIQRVVITRS